MGLSRDASILEAGGVAQAQAELGHRGDNEGQCLQALLTDAGTTLGTRMTAETHLPFCTEANQKKTGSLVRLMGLEPGGILASPFPTHIFFYLFSSPGFGWPPACPGPLGPAPTWPQSGPQPTVLL